MAEHPIIRNLHDYGTLGPGSFRDYLGTACHSPGPGADPGQRPQAGAGNQNLERPAGSSMPHTVPLFWYSFQPEPDR